MINPDLDPELVVQTVVGAWEDWTQQRQPKEKIWDECTQNYMVQIDEQKYQGFPWRSKVADTLSQETADTTASSILNGLFPMNEQYFELIGEDPLGQTHAQTMQQYQERELQRIKFIESIRPWVKQLCVIGNAPYIGRYGSVRRPVKRRERQTNAITGRRSVKVVREDAVETCLFQGLDAYDVAFNYHALGSDAQPMVWRCLTTWDQLSRMPNLDREGLAKVEAEIKGGGAPNETSDALKQKRARAFGFETKDGEQPTENEQGADGQIELLIAYGDWCFDGELYEDYVCIVAGREVLLKATDCPFWAGSPLGWAGYDQLWMTNYEKGPLEPIRGVQALIDTFQNQKADILNLIINGAFAYVDDGIIDPESLWLRPGGFIEVGDINNLKPLQPAQNVALTYTEIEQLRARAERSSGSSRFEMGQAPGGRRTAYEANLIRSGSSGRANDILKHLANGPLESYLRWHLGTLQQMKWNSGVVPNDALLGRYRLNYLGADLTALRQFQIQNLQMALQIIAQAPEEMTVDLNPRYIWKKLFQALTMDDADAMVPKAEADRKLALLAKRKQDEAAAAQQQAVPEQPGSGPGGQDENLLQLVGGQPASEAA